MATDDDMNYFIKETSDTDRCGTLGFNLFSTPVLGWVFTMRQTCIMEKDHKFFLFVAVSTLPIQRTDRLVPGCELNR